MSDPITRITFRNRDEFFLGDEVNITLNPDGAVFQGFINEINFVGGYIVLTATGHSPVPGFTDTLCFPLDDITRMVAV